MPLRQYRHHNSKMDSFLSLWEDLQGIKPDPEQFEQESRCALGRIGAGFRHLIFQTVRLLSGTGVGLSY
jgi:hypothetical protein